MLVHRKFYAAVRRTEGREWISTQDIAVLPEMARTQAALSDNTCGPSWVKANPVVRFVLIEVTEIETIDDMKRERAAPQPSDKLRDQEQPNVLGYDLDRKTLTPIRKTVEES